MKTEQVLLLIATGIFTFYAYKHYGITGVMVTVTTSLIVDNLTTLEISAIQKVIAK